MPACGVARRRAPSIVLVTAPPNVVGSMPESLVLLRAVTSS
jgi:hypothetical protein